jgi:hypothetical protein
MVCRVRVPRDKYFFPNLVPTGPWAECGGDIIFATTCRNGRRGLRAAVAGCFRGGDSAVWFFDEGIGPGTPNRIKRVVLLVALSGGRAIAVVSRSTLPTRRVFALEPGARFGQNLDTPRASAWVRALTDSAEPRAVSTSDGEVVVVLSNDGSTLVTSTGGCLSLPTRCGVRDISSAARTLDGGLRVLLCTSAGPVCLLLSSDFELIRSVKISGLPPHVSYVESATDNVAVVVEHPAGLALARRALCVGNRTSRIMDPVMDSGAAECTLMLISNYAVAVVPWARGLPVRVQSIRTGIGLALAQFPRWYSIVGPVRGGIAFWSPVGTKGLTAEIVRIPESCPLDS